MRCRKFLNRTFVLVVFSWTLLLFPAPSNGAVFCVSNETQLENALSQAAHNGEDDLIRIAKGLYEGNFAYDSDESNSLTLEGGYASDCMLRKVDPGNTILDGGSTDRVLFFNSNAISDLSIEGLTFQHGFPQQQMGLAGGLFAYTNGSVDLSNNIFTGNAGAAAGGLYTNTTSILTNNTFMENGSYLKSGNGGAVLIDGDGVLTGNTFVGNGTMGSGGGVYVSGFGTIVDNTFTGNTANEWYGFGGGICAAKGGTFVNNVFAENKAAYGGGVAAGSKDDKDAYLTMINNTFSANFSQVQGGGMTLSFPDREGYRGELYNNIIWNSTTIDGSDIYIDNTGSDGATAIPVDMFNNDFDQSAKGIHITEPFPIDPSNLDNADPLFEGDGNYRLTALSPCINTGDNDAPYLPPGDRDGYPRIVDGIVDMGAYEYQPVTYAFVDKDDETCGGKTPCYAGIQQAINASSHKAVINVVAGNYEEKITMDEFKTLTLKGGWDAAFTAQTSNTTIKGSLVIRDGELKTNRIKVHFQQ